MKTLVELNKQTHKTLNIAPKSMEKKAATQHVMHLRAEELANAATCFPVFATRNTRNGFWTFSAMTSFELNNNLFVDNDVWQPSFLPTSLLTHPIYLMKSPRDESSYTFGILEDSDDFSSTQGEALFDAQGKPSAKLQQITNILEADVKRDIQTAEFSRVIEDLGLFKALDMNVEFNDGRTEKIKGLHTINEERLQSITVDELDNLRKQGYLTPLHAMLISIFQINGLINKHNQKHPHESIANIKMEVSKD